MANATVSSEKYKEAVVYNDKTKTTTMRSWSWRTLTPFLTLSLLLQLMAATPSYAVYAFFLSDRNPASFRQRRQIPPVRLSRLPRPSQIRSPNPFHSTIKQTRDENENYPNFQIRDWIAGDEEELRTLLQSALRLGEFDPEGPLDIDVGRRQAIQESYNRKDGGCMIVATTTNDDDSYSNRRIIGTAGLILGTQITYLPSGASVSTPQTVTGAIRRVVVSCGTPTTDSTMTRRTTTTSTTAPPSLPTNKEDDEAEVVLRSLLLELEERARQNGATELILLAYPTTTTTSGTRSNSSSSNRPRRPTASLVQGLGYQPLPVNLKGVEAVQFYKALNTASPNDDNGGDGVTFKDRTFNNNSKRDGVIFKDRTVNNDSKSAAGDQSAGAEATSTTAALLSTLALFCALVVIGVANLMGFDLSPSMMGSSVGVYNRGMGTPLSIQELQRLQRDEVLQRTDLDANNDNNDSASGLPSAARSWEDLSPEERREEAALIKIIQGQEVRIRKPLFPQ
jgi:hypothetical protein